jgi:hypothetical protein
LSLILNNFRDENFGHFSQQELDCIEEEEYFDRKEDEEPQQPSTTTIPRKNGKKFLDEDQLSVSSIENEKLSEPDLESARDYLLKIKNKIALKNKQDEEEEKVNNFSRKELKRISSIDKITSKIDINLKINSASEASDSDNESISYNQKRWGSDLESEEEIKEESKIETQKRIKS